MSAPRVLVATLAIDYPAPARLPWELKQAGCEVALFAPAGSLAAHASHVDRRAIAAGRATTAAWVELLAARDRRVRSRDRPARRRRDGAHAARARARSAARRRLGHASRRSCARRSATSSSPATRSTRTRLFELARAAGLAVAEGGVATTSDEAVAIAASLGYPVIVRAGAGTGGDGTTRCESADDVAEAMRGVRVPDGWMPPAPRRALVQRWIDGPVIVRASLAWRGDEVAGSTRGRLATYPHALGPGSAVVYAGIPSIAGATRALLRALDASGFVGTQFIVEPGTGTPLLLEINRRMIPATYGSRHAGIDQAQALAACCAASAGTDRTTCRRARARGSRCSRRSGTATSRARGSPTCPATRRGTTPRCSARC
jgi:hypothetical protein